MTNMIHAPTVPDSVIPNICIGGFTGPLFGSGSFSWSPYNRWIFTPSLSMTKGTHSLHFGFEVQLRIARQQQPGPGLRRFHLRLRPDAARHGPHASTRPTSSSASPACCSACPTSGNIDNNTNYYISRPYYGLVRAGRLEGQPSA